MAEYKIRGVGNKELNVMFGDFCYYNQHTLHERYTPLGIGLIAQYINERFGDEVSVSIHKDVNKFLEKSLGKNTCMTKTLDARHKDNLVLLNNLNGALA